MSRRWDSAAHEALLLCLIDEVKANKAILTNATSRMNEMGFPYSYDAIKQV